MEITQTKNPEIFKNSHNGVWVCIFTVDGTNMDGSKYSGQSISHGDSLIEAVTSCLAFVMFHNNLESNLLS